ncbi:MAG: hypothetical protein ABI672_00440 [Vicinamibacteria bacterium]
MSRRPLDPIPTSVVDQAWEDVAAIPLSKIPMEMEKAAREQPDLLAFILGATEGMTAGVGELAGFIYIVIWRAFRRETRGKRKPISGAAIQGKLMANEDALIALDGLDPQSSEAPSVESLTSQPALLQYVFEAIAEAEEDENQPVQMSPEEKGSLILLLKTAIDVLDDVRNEAN